MKPHRIAIVIDGWDTTWGGGQVHVAQLCHHLTQSFPLSLDLFTRALPRQSKQRITQEKPNWRILRVGPETSFFHPIGRIVTLFTLFLKLCSEHRKQPYALVHAHTYLGVLPAYAFAKWAKIPLIVTLHGTNLSDQHIMSPSAWVEKLIVEHLKFNRTISVTQKYLLDHPKRPNTLYIPNGVDVTRFSAMTRPHAGPAIKLISVGRFDPVKGFDILIRALARVPFSFELSLIGNGPIEAALKKTAKEAGIAEHIHFKGFKTGNDLVKEYHEADLFVLASRSEGFPLTLLEAMSTGLPVIATRVGEIPHLITGDEGWLTTPEDLDGLVLALEQAYNAKKDWAHIGRHNASLIRDHYSWDTMARETYRAYISTQDTL